MTEIGPKIKSSRKLKHITQQELADQIQISRSAVANWESGRNYPDLDAIVQLSDLLDISLDQLLREDTQMVSTVSEEQRKNQRRKIYLRILVPIICMLTVVTGYFLYHENNLVHNFFTPSQQMQAEILPNHHQVALDTVEFTDFRWRREIINDISNNQTLKFQIMNQSGTKLIAEFTLKAGQGQTLNKLSYRTKCQVRILGKPGIYSVNTN